MKKTKQSGFTLIELVIALTVIGVLMPIVYQHWQIGYIAEQQSHAADQLRQVNDASDAYIKRHFDTLLSSTTPSSGPQITIDQLVNDGLLPEGFRNSNIWGQSYEICSQAPRKYAEQHHDHTRRARTQRGRLIRHADGARCSSPTWRRGRFRAYWCAPRSTRWNTARRSGRIHPRSRRTRYHFPRTGAPWRVLGFRRVRPRDRLSLPRRGSRPPRVQPDANRAGHDRAWHRERGFSAVRFADGNGRGKLLDRR